MDKRCFPLLCVVVLAALLHADGPGDNLPDKVRPVPPKGINLDDAERSELQAGVDALGKDIEELRQDLKDNPALLELLPDVQIFHNAVRYALTYDEFYDRNETAIAHKLLAQAKERAKQLRAGQAPWTTATGLIVRGYRSKIDGSVQPYGLVVPATYRANSPYEYRLDIWCHGRGEKLTELSFLNARQSSPGEFTPKNAFVLHLYGRYCNANKFAGEIDCLEALAHVRKHYPIDEDRIVMRGFSMGGAACWQFAVHYAGMWAAAAPGAGFSETADFLKVFQNEKTQPTWYEKKLWHWYDCTDYAANLFNCPVVAYSGERDGQKQAADKMAAAMKKDGMKLTHLIGPKTGHSYEAKTKEELNRRIDSIVKRGRDSVPLHVRFTTWTLRYPKMFWVHIDGLEKQWSRAEVDAALLDGVSIKTRNVAALTLHFEPGYCPLEVTEEKPKVAIDADDDDEEATIKGVPQILSDRSWTVHFRKKDGAWEVVEKADDGSLRKRPGLQGPIDDAFMDSFLMVRPTGKPLHDKVGAWASAEMKHAVDHWRKQFRGEARVKDDAAVTDKDIAEHNLVLWGDPSSNAVLAKIADKLPVRWDGQQVRLGEETFSAEHHVPLLIYPNPLNPKRYVVLNSGFTFREYDYLNNARQVPKLPDFAVIDVRTPPSSRLPGKVVTAGFFDEEWKLPPKED
ncbi:MAG: prolyl oligopeptidase family serine peptidase [Gemmataceae bacterium]